MRCVAAMSSRVSDVLHPKLVVLAESTVTPEPCEGALHNPREPGDLESTLPTFCDLQLPTSLMHQLAGKFSAFMTGICDHGIDSRKQKGQAGEQTSARASVRRVGWFHSIGNHQADCIHQNMALAPFHALVSVEAACATTRQLDAQRTRFQLTRDPASNARKSVGAKTFFLELPCQPGLCQFPIAHHGLRGNCQNHGGFIDAHRAEEAQFDYPRFSGVDPD